MYKRIHDTRHLRKKIGQSSAYSPTLTLEATSQRGAIDRVGSECSCTFPAAYFNRRSQSRSLCVSLPALIQGWELERRTMDKPRQRAAACRAVAGGDVHISCRRPVPLPRGAAALVGAALTLPPPSCRIWRRPPATQSSGPAASYGTVAACATFPGAGNYFRLPGGGCGRAGIVSPPSPLNRATLSLRRYPRNGSEARSHPMHVVAQNSGLLYCGFAIRRALDPLVALHLPQRFPFVRHAEWKAATRLDDDPCHPNNGNPSNHP